MGSLYRSAEMEKCQLFLQAEAAYSCVAELGELGLVQFRDLNEEVNSFQRKFVNEVRRCDEMERKLRFFEGEIKAADIDMPETDQNPDAPKPREMVDLEASLEQLESELKEINSNDQKLKKSFVELTELRHILTKTQHFFEERDDALALQELTDAQMMEQESGYLNGGLDLEGDTAATKKEASSDLKFVAGVIRREKEAVFERLLWRSCRGNIFMRKEEIDEPIIDPITNDPVNKSVFVIFFQGSQLDSRIKKICHAFKATLYPCPENPEERRSMTMGVLTRLEDLGKVIDRTREHRLSNLSKMARKMVTWYAKVRKMKAIYHILNMLSVDVTSRCLIAECWCPRDDLDKIRIALKRGNDESGSSVPSILNRVDTNESPPTYHRVNKFTRGFQNIVDAYGIAGYRECNPAPYTIISFPFLFAIMFGDAGHGMVMFFAALSLIVFERKLQAMKIKDEIFSTFFNGRYIVLLMGVFSIYTGSVYNEMYARSLNIYGSTWKTDYLTPSVIADGIAKDNKFMLLPEKSFNNVTYPYGFDPIWNIALNKISFQDSFKMKMSVIVGITQMCFGVFLSLMNFTYRKSYLDVFTVFLPQIIFLFCIFVYLCLQIFIKWTNFGVHVTENMLGAGLYQGSHCAPSLLIGLINMFMFASREVGFVGSVEKMLVVFAVLAVPVMLFVKPFVLRHRHNKQVGTIAVRADMGTDDIEVLQNGKAEASHGGHSGGHGGHGHGDEFDFSEIFIHQIIQTIEFCLGCISHTASYLRLWALSLAHAELSEVLWTMVLRNGFKMLSGPGGIIALYLVFWAFSGLTVAVLILMEGLSAFLHTLRLHWYS